MSETVCGVQISETFTQASWHVDHLTTHHFLALRARWLSHQILQSALQWNVWGSLWCANQGEMWAVSSCSDDATTYHFLHTCRPFSHKTWWSFYHRQSLYYEMIRFYAKHQILYSIIVFQHYVLFLFNADMYNGGYFVHRVWGLFQGSSWGRFSGKCYTHRPIHLQSVLHGHNWIDRYEVMLLLDTCRISLPFPSQIQQKTLYTQMQTTLQSPGYLPGKLLS